MIYALILTTYMFGSFDKSPVAIAQTSTSGFTTEQACKNAGKIAQSGAVQAPSQTTVVTYQCSAMSL